MRVSMVRLREFARRLSDEELLVVPPIDGDLQLGPAQAGGGEWRSDVENVTQKHPAETAGAVPSHARRDPLLAKLGRARVKYLLPVLLLAGCATNSQTPVQLATLPVHELCYLQVTGDDVTRQRINGIMYVRDYNCGPHMAYVQARLQADGTAEAADANRRARLLQAAQQLLTPPPRPKATTCHTSYVAGSMLTTCN